MRSVLVTILLASNLAAGNLVGPISGFGANPGNLAMYHYKPAGLADGHALVVLLHGCTQNANGYFTNSGWRKFADAHGFALVLPQAGNCFTWYENGDTTRGQGEALSIRNMVAHATSNLGASADKVYVSGLSAGGGMTAAMLATYPEVFKAGSIAAGLAYRCTTVCMYSPPIRTPQQWGDLVRGAYPGHTGPYPRVAVWQGTSDATVVQANATELRDQWTNVRGVSTTPTSTSSLPGGVSVEVYGTNNDVRVYRIIGMGHGLPVDPGSAANQCGNAAAFFLDTICSAYHDGVFFGLFGGSEPPPVPPGECVSTNNYQHTVDGRAYHSLGYTYARGSNQNMGLWNTFTTTSLRRTAPDYWVIGC